MTAPPHVLIIEALYYSHIAAELRINQAAFRTRNCLFKLSIVDAFPRNAIGRLIVSPGVSRPQLQEGDNVWSQLKRN